MYLVLLVYDQQPVLLLEQLAGIHIRFDQLYLSVLHLNPIGRDYSKVVIGLKVTSVEKL